MQWPGGLRREIGYPEEDGPGREEYAIIDANELDATSPAFGRDTRVLLAFCDPSRAGLPLTGFSGLGRVPDGAPP